MTVLAGSTTNTAKLLSVAAPVPTSGSGALPFTTLATVNSASAENYVGIAFAADSSLYVETLQGELIRVNPNDGTITNLGTMTGIVGSPRDLASCSFNGSLQAQKNIVGRVTPTDQFTMTITGGGVTSGNTGTTSGSSTGLQTSPGSVAGPIVGIPGTTYSVVESAASGSLSNYRTTWSCLNGSNPFSSGTGTSFNVPFPSATGSAGASLVCTFTNAPASIAVTKTPSPTSVTAAGQTITYSYAVTNTGPLPLTGVTLADTQTPPAGALTSGPTCVSLSIPAGSCSGSTVATLATGQRANFTATYTVSQADMNHGSVADSATATGHAPSGTPVSASATASVTASQTSSISIVKSASPTILTAAGQTITYTFEVTNTGNTSLSNVNVTDHPTPPAGPLTTGPTCQSLSNPAGSCSGSTTTLAPNQRATFSGTYTVTQTDFDNGTVVDNATATGTPPSGPPVTGTSNTVTVDESSAPGIAVTKAASPTSVTAAGQIVTYTYTVVNTGNVTLIVGVDDIPQAPAGGVTPICQSLSSPTGTCSGPTTTLRVGQIATFTGTYTVRQGDIDHGSIRDTAVAKGVPPAGPPVFDTSNPVTITGVELPSLSIGKSANPTTVTAAGQNVAYTFSVTNSGNVDLTGVGVGDVPVNPAGGVTPTCVVLTSPAGGCSGLTTPLVAGPNGPVHRHLRGDPGRHQPRPHPGHGRRHRYVALEHPGDRDIESGHGQRDPVAFALHRQDGHADHGQCRRPADQLHLYGHQHGQPDSHLGGGHRRPDRARRRRHCHLSEPDEPVGYVLGGDDHLGAGPDGHLQRHLYGDAGRRQPRLDRRPRHDPGHDPLERHGQRLLQHGHGQRDPVAFALHRQDGHPDHGQRRRPAASTTPLRSSTPAT